MFATRPARMVKRVHPRQRAVYTAAERIERDMERALLEQIKALQAEGKLSEIAEAIQVASPDEVLELVNARGVKGIGTALEPHVVSGAAAGAQVAAKELGKVLVLDMRRPHFQRWLREHMSTMVKQTSGTSIKALKVTLRDGINRGRHPMRLAKDLRQSIGLTDPHAKAVAKLRLRLEAEGVPAARADKQIDAYRQKLLRYRARNIARTESMQSVSAGRQKLWEQLTADDAWPGDKPPKKSWLTSLDEAVCFPAWTTVETPAGPRPIQQIRPGDMVLTRHGTRRVVATSAREYAGRMVDIRTTTGQVTATAGHPFWANGGWTRAEDVRSGALLQGVGHELAHALGVVHRDLGKADRGPPVIGEIAVAAGVLGGVSVPVCPVCLDDDAPVGEHKVRAVPADLDLLREGDAKSIQRASDLPLQPRFSGVSAVAGKAAKLPVIIGRLAAKFLPTGLAGDDHGRASAFIRAVLSRVPFLGVVEDSPAPRALGIDGFGSPAGSRTHSVPVGVGAVDDEGLAADGTDLGHLRGDSNVVACPAAVPSASCLGAGVSVDHLAARGARNLAPRPGCSLVAGPGAENTRAAAPLRHSECLAASVAGVVKWHCWRLLSRVGKLYQGLSGKATVYNLQVDEHPEFYANGILVHNCPICAPMNGQRREINETWSVGEPSFAHPSCRCTAVLVEQ